MKVANILNSQNDDTDRRDMERLTNAIIAVVQPSNALSRLFYELEADELGELLKEYEASCTKMFNHDFSTLEATWGARRDGQIARPNSKAFRRAFPPSPASISTS